MTVLRGRAHDAAHPLPTSNGWSGGNGDVVVWCGRCKDYFVPDLAWADRYYDKQRERISRRGGFDPFAWRPLTELENSRALEAIEEDRRYLKNLLTKQGVDTP